MYDITKYVMAYTVDKEKLQNLLPRNFHSLRGVIRVTVESMKEVPWLNGSDCVRVELNTPVSNDDRRGWFNIVTWVNRYVTPSKERDIPINTTIKADMTELKGEDGATVSIWTEEGASPFVNIEFDKTGDIGGCPFEEDNEGTFYYSKDTEDNVTCYFRPIEVISENQENCKGEIYWEKKYLKDIPFKYANVHEIVDLDMGEKLGAYVVKFQRKLRELEFMKIMGNDIGN